MNQTGANAQMDAVLLPFLSTAGEPQATEHLSHLIAQATPEIAKITRFSRTPDDAFQEAAQRLVRHLREMRRERRGEAIANYPNYVKVVASRVVKGQVREANPAYRSVCDSVRHVLRREGSLASWSDGRVKICGLAEWRASGPGRVRSERLKQLLDDPQSFYDVAPQPGPIASLSNTTLVLALFNYIGHPIAFGELVRIVCGLRQIGGASPVSHSDGVTKPLSEWAEDKGWRPDQYAEWREFLARLWMEIQRLPRLQRMAYLLNFTAGHGQLELFRMYGVASIRRIGETLDITAEEFARAWEVIALPDERRERAIACAEYDERFAILWQALPLKDSEIAHVMRTERQKVINLRKAAGERLSRKMSQQRSRTTP